MPIWDVDEYGSSRRIPRLWDVQQNGATSIIGRAWDVQQNGNTNLVYQNIRYLVRSTIPQTAFSQGLMEEFGGGSFTLGSYGLKGITGGIGNEQVTGSSLGTTAAVDMSLYRYISFTFTWWGRDNSDTGYFRTCAGVYSNRVFGRGGTYYTLSGPSSMQRGWLCNELPGRGGTYTLDISAISSAYVGMSTCGGYQGNGTVLVSDIWMHN